VGEAIVAGDEVSVTGGEGGDLKLDESGYLKTEITRPQIGPQNHSLARPVQDLAISVLRYPDSSNFKSPSVVLGHTIPSFPREEGSLV
jgi:hypothetical protein